MFQFIEEFEILRDEINEEIKDSNSHLHKKIEDLQEVVAKLKNERQEERMIVATLEQLTKK